MKRSHPTGLYLILDHDSIGTRSPVDVAGAAFAAGVRWLQYRGKERSKREAFGHARAIASVAEIHGAAFLINDEVDLVLAAGASGVHLGQDDLPASVARSLLGPDRIIGVSAHTPDQARRAQTDGADYVGVGPIFLSRTKQARPPLGCGALRSFKSAVSIPVVAIGGITMDNVGEVLLAGADSVAVASDILSGADVGVAVTRFLARMESERMGRD